MQWRQVSLFTKKKKNPSMNAASCPVEVGGWWVIERSKLTLD
jgi:hypothetical protein